MISVEEAQKLILEKLPAWEIGTKVIKADRDYPPFDRVMMDGIAISFDEYLKGQREFQITGTVAAGEPQRKLLKGCLEVMTGAPLPEGADLVIPYEHLRIEKRSAFVNEEISRKRFDSVHIKGSDCLQGDVVLNKGLSWNGPHVGIAASMGESFLKTSPKVMIISTGDELVERDPLPHQIRRSNAYALKKSMVLFGFTNVKLDHLSDDPHLVSKHYEKNADDFDLLIYSGGVSKGKFDYLPGVWADLNVKKIFHGVTQRPGKPLWVGLDQLRKTTVVGLPGNPVSGLVCLHRYFLPRRNIFVKLSEEVMFNKPLTYFLPVTLRFESGEVWACPQKIKNSGEFTALAGSDGFIELPKELETFSKGEVFKFYPWRPM